MTRTNNPTGSAGWLRHATASSPLLNRLNIHRRLTLCFIFIIVLMLIGTGVLLWQLHLISAQVEGLNGVNEELIEVLRVHTGLLSAYERLGAAARSEDSGRLLKEWETLRAGLAEDAQRAQAADGQEPRGRRDVRRHHHVREALERRVVELDEPKIGLQELAGALELGGLGHAHTEEDLAVGHGA